LPEPLQLPEAVQGHRGRDTVEPGGEGRLAAERVQALEGADERLLGEVAREVVVAGHAIRQPVYAVDMRVVQRPLRRRVSGADSGDQFTVVHGAPENGGSLLPQALTHMEGKGLRGKKSVGRGGWDAPQKGGIRCFMGVSHVPTSPRLSAYRRADLPHRRGRGGCSP